MRRYGVRRDPCGPRPRKHSQRNFKGVPDAGSDQRRRLRRRRSRGRGDGRAGRRVADARRAAEGRRRRAAGLGVLAALRPGAARARGGGSKANDIKILNFALTLEYLEAAFYLEALQRGGFTGSVRNFAQVVYNHEATHVSTLQGVLGAKAVKRPSFDFKGTTRKGWKLFLGTAKVLEDTGVAAYQGQAPLIHQNAVLAPAGAILAVEARTPRGSATCCTSARRSSRRRRRSARRCPCPKSSARSSRPASSSPDPEAAHARPSPESICQTSSASTPTAHSRKPPKRPRSHSRREFLRTSGLALGGARGRRRRAARRRVSLSPRATSRSSTSRSRSSTSRPRSTSGRIGEHRPAGALERFARSRAAHKSGARRRARARRSGMPPSSGPRSPSAPRSRTRRRSPPPRSSSRTPASWPTRARRRSSLPGRVQAAISIHPVEARHAAWIRNYRGLEPASSAFNPALTKEAVLSAVTATGFISPDAGRHRPMEIAIVAIVALRGAGRRSCRTVGR